MHDKISIKELREVVIQSFLKQRLEVASSSKGGDFLPLSVYQKKGYDCKTIEEKTKPCDIEYHPVLGNTYRVAIHNTSEATEERKIREMLIKRENEAKGRARQRVYAAPAPASDKSERSEEEGDVPQSSPLPGVDAKMLQNLILMAAQQDRKGGRQTGKEENEAAKAALFAARKEEGQKQRRRRSQLNFAEKVVAKIFPCQCLLQQVKKEALLKECPKWTQDNVEKALFCAGTRSQAGQENFTRRRVGVGC